MAEQSQELVQKNVKLPAPLLAAYERYKAAELEKTAKRIKDTEIIGPAIFHWLNPYEDLSFAQARWKAKIEKAEIILRKRIAGKDVEIELTPQDIALVFQKLREIEVGDAYWTGEKQQS